MGGETSFITAYVPNLPYIYISLNLGLEIEINGSFSFEKHELLSGCEQCFVTNRVLLISFCRSQIKGEKRLRT